VRTPVFVVPHPVVETEAAMERARRRAPALRAPLEARGARTVVVAPGDLNEAKQLGPLLAAVARLAREVHAVLVGRRIEGYDVDREVAAAGLGERVTLANDVDDDDFRGWLCAADLAVDLRYPHRGEVSGSLSRAMQAGLPTVVSATGTYLDVPDELVRRVAPGPADPEELAAALRDLIEDEGLRVRMGAAARARIDEQRATEATAHGYERAIEETLGLVRDPVRKAEARWAGALADIGIGEPQLDAGYGVGYARALESFRDGPGAGEPVSRRTP
jgi:glycosyltransferase involved in cell wall biosynthesis